MVSTNPDQPGVFLTVLEAVQPGVFNSSTERIDEDEYAGDQVESFYNCAEVWKAMVTDHNGQVKTVVVELSNLDHTLEPGPFKIRSVIDLMKMP
jgi:hypothetical protein